MMKKWLQEIPAVATHPVLAKVAAARKESVIYPAAEMVYNALQLTDFDRVRVVILGQDPYHGAGQAHGLAFSVPEGVNSPPSLRNIHKELHRDLGLTGDRSNDLSHWAKQGVLLLNTVLTVEAGNAGSHRGWGWEDLTDSIIRVLSSRRENLIFLLWGNDAKKKIPLIDAGRHTVLTTSHPSGLSVYRGFSGCGHFSQVNATLIGLGQTPISW
jgi:uracil-DNA glycosylase